MGVLGKCLDIEAKLKEDGTRETVDDMKLRTDPINVQLYKCHGKHNQQWDIVDSTLKSSSLGLCLEVKEVDDNQNIYISQCTGDQKQKWDITALNYMKSQGSEKCVDVKALKKADGTREKFDEIKAHKVVNVHLYKCHDAEKTQRVNQLWSVDPMKGDTIITASCPISDEVKCVGVKFEDFGFTMSSVSGYGTIALAVVGAVSLFGAGVFVGRRAHRSPLRTPMTMDVE